MALPKFSELSTILQISLIVLLAAILGAVSEYMLLKPLSDGNALKQKQADQLDKDLAPLRPYEAKQRQLLAENQQLQGQLLNLRQIVPDEKEVDTFIRSVEDAAQTSGVQVRRFTAKPVAHQDYYDEAPFETELDGPYYQVLNFYDRLSKMARIINVSDLKVGGIESGKSVGNKQYVYNSNESVVAVCTITTFFSREDLAAPPSKPGQPPPPKK